MHCPFYKMIRFRAIGILSMAPFFILRECAPQFGLGVRVQMVGGLSLQQPERYILEYGPVPETVSQMF